MSERVNFWNARNNLRNRNRCGDPSRAPRCGAKARSRGNQPCLAPAVRGSARCRMHGGLSTGPRTPEGLERSRRARWKHGRYSQAARAGRRLAGLMKRFAPTDGPHAPRKR
jgi:hypothetical protein